MIYVTIVLPGVEGGDVRVVSIRRIVGGTGRNDNNQYVVTADGTDWEATFGHRYGDGWMLCVARALTALEEAAHR